MPVSEIWKVEGRMVGNGAVPGRPREGKGEAMEREHVGRAASGLRRGHIHRPGKKNKRGSNIY